jgi:hypothetical protein
MHAGRSLTGHPETTHPDLSDHDCHTSGVYIGLDSEIIFCWYYRPSQSLSAFVGGPCLAGHAVSCELPRLDRSVWVGRCLGRCKFLDRSLRVENHVCPTLTSVTLVDSDRVPSPVSHDDVHAVMWRVMYVLYS